VWDLDLTVSPDRDTFTNYSGEDVRTWATGTGQELFPVSEASLVAVSADGLRMAQFQDGATRIIDVRTGGQVCTIPATWPHDTSAIEDGPVATITVDDQADVPTFEPMSWVSPEASFSPDGRMFTTVLADGETIQVWNVLDGSLAATLRGHVGQVHAVQYADDRTLISTGLTDATVRIWDVPGR
jgi:WD40 repeat protein